MSLFFFFCRWTPNHHVNEAIGEAKRTQFRGHTIIMRRSLKMFNLNGGHILR